eukprot:TRINITY_DN29706_c0_g1_i1.p1 TRINITY_DN29706_c0_g1~~TRINITY_DN29706_c0_g1_i1.p1  ORF type:complete len:2798 (-),score=431.91 TRINITY_DN29706_c0_g1_i1:203-7405(-)
MRRCLAEALCEGYVQVSEPGACELWKRCSGRYNRDSDVKRKVGYCRRSDGPPVVHPGEALCCTRVGEAWSETIPATCEDMEDPVQPVVSRSTLLNVDAAGTYTVSYTCTDLAGQTTTANRTVIVTGLCDVADLGDENCPKDAATGQKSPCTQGLIDYKADDLCTPVCTTGYTPTRTALYCRQTNITEPDVAWEDHFVCGFQACDMPTGDLITGNKVKYDAAGQPTTCQEGSAVAHGDVCTTNCRDTFVPNVPSLACAFGVLTPTVYECYEKADTPNRVTAQQILEESVVLVWGDYSKSNDCVFSHWSVESRITYVPNGLTDVWPSTQTPPVVPETIPSNWASVPGCEVASLTVRTTATCTARNRLEGTSYEYRVKEECTNNLLNSPWNEEGDEITGPYVKPPTVIFVVPNASVYTKPEVIMIASDEKLLQQNQENATFNITKHCPWIPPVDDTFTFTNEEVSDIAPEKGTSGAQLTGQRIVIITPPPDFIQDGCIITLTSERGFVGTLLTPAKPMPLTEWTFTFVDVRPRLVSFAVLTTTINEATIRLQWHLAARFSCKARATLLGQGCGRNPPPPAARCEDKHSDGGLGAKEVKSTAVWSALGQLQEFYHTPAPDFTISGLFPGTQYMVDCVGHKYRTGTETPEIFWVDVEDRPEAMEAAVIFDTKEDTESGISLVSVIVRLVCADKTTTFTTKAIDPTMLGFGYTFRVAPWLDECNGGANLLHGEVASIQFEAVVTRIGPDSELIFDADAGPTILMEYQAQDGVDVVLKKQFVFKVCSLAHYNYPDTYPCSQYSLQITVVDMQFTFADLLLGGSPVALASATNTNLQIADNETVAASVEESASRRLAELPPGFTGATAVTGWQCSVTAQASSASLDWADTALYLGAPGDGFKLPVTRDLIDGQSVMKFTIGGVGYDIPLIFLWSGALFQTNYAISISPPTIKSVSPAIGSLVAQTPLSVAFGNLPDIAQYETQSSPGFFFEIEVVKQGRTEQLCSNTVFQRRPADNQYDWTTAQCILEPGALDDLIVSLRLRNYLQQEYRSAASTIGRAGLLAYMSPTLSRVISDGPGSLGEAGSYDGTVSIGLLAKNSAEALLFIDGADLPNVAGIRLAGAAVPGYDLRMEFVNQTKSLCSRIDFFSTQRLICYLEGCIDLTGLTYKPKVRLYLGDLASPEELANSITFPRPRIDVFGPDSILDVGQDRQLWFQGEFFGFRECFGLPRDGYSTQLYYEAGANILVGDSRAVCRPYFQNDTHVNCTLTAPVHFPWTVGEEDGGPTVLGRPRTMTDQNIIFEAGDLGSGLLAVNGDDDVPESARQDPVTGELVPELRLTAYLAECDKDGMQRARLDLPTCEPCRPGRSMLRTDRNWPLMCTECPVGRYQDEYGALECKRCPGNTMTTAYPDKVESCTCKPGFYSQHYNVSALKDSSVRARSADAGTACVRCSDDLMEEPLESECQDKAEIADLCESVSTDTCVSLSPPLLQYRVCKAGCPGGRGVPIAKRTFWLLEHEDKTSSPGGVLKYEPVFVRCDPPHACRGFNLCELQHEGTRCATCRLGYFPVLNQLCEPCGFWQQVGTIVMSALAMGASIGGLLGLSVLMRVQSDLQFRQKFILAVKRNVVEPLSKSKFMFDMAKSSDKTIMVVLSRREVGLSYQYLKTGEMGLCFRVDDRQVVHVAGVHKTSPLYGRVAPGWKLQTVNGHRLKTSNDSTVQRIVDKAHLPLKLRFSCPALSSSTVKTDEDDDGEDMGFNANDRKMAIVLLGCMNAFSTVKSFEFEWPPIFLEIARIAQYFTFNLDFFKTECATSMTYSESWLSFSLVPYFMMLPLAGAFMITKFVMLFGLSPSARRVRSYLVRNSTARTACMLTILLLPFHIGQLLIPFCCSSSGGRSFLSAPGATTIECSLDEETGQYKYMFVWACFLTFCVLGFYTFLLSCITKSYHWQFKIKARHDIPFYCAMVEASVQGQLGYHKEVRMRVETNISNVQSFQVKELHLRTRERLTQAIEQLGWRSRDIQKEARSRRGKVPIAEYYEGLASLLNYGDFHEEASKTLSVAEKVQDQVQANKARRKFTIAQRHPAERNGRVLTYGWIFIVNQFLRSVISGAVLRLTHGATVVGASFQMLIIWANVALLIVFSPYQDEKIAKTECTMMSALFLVLWGAIMKELVSDHRNAETMQGLVSITNTLMDVMAVVLLGLVALIPTYQASQFAKKTLNAMKGMDFMLNQIRWNMHLKDKEQQEKAENPFSEGGYLWVVEDSKDGPQPDNVLQEAMTAGYPTINKTLLQLQERAEQNASVEQRRQLSMLIELIKSNKKAILKNVAVERERLSKQHDRTVQKMATMQSIVTTKSTKKVLSLQGKQNSHGEDRAAAMRRRRQHGRIPQWKKKPGERSGSQESFDAAVPTDK